MQRKETSLVGEGFLQSESYPQEQRRGSGEKRHKDEATEARPEVGEKTALEMVAASLRKKSKRKQSFANNDKSTVLIRKQRASFEKSSRRQADKENCLASSRCQASFHNTDVPGIYLRPSVRQKSQ